MLYGPCLLSWDELAVLFQSLSADHRSVTRNVASISVIATIAEADPSRFLTNLRRYCNWLLTMGSNPNRAITSLSKMLYSTNVLGFGLWPSVSWGKQCIQKQHLFRSQSVIFCIWIVGIDIDVIGRPVEFSL